jgi:hypothetical protein
MPVAVNNVYRFVDFAGAGAPASNDWDQEHSISSSTPHKNNVLLYFFDIIRSIPCTGHKSRIFTYTWD